MSKPLNRRAFLATGAVATAGLLIAAPRPAGAAATITVYRLNADWGYPVGPKGKTRCACRSCFRRAESAYFRTRAAAIAGRVHPCCVCQPYRTMLAGVSADQLFVEAGDSADQRDPRVAAVIEGATVPATDPIPGISDPILGPISGFVGIDPPSPSAPAPAAALGFARTGTTLRLAAVGASVITIGGALLAFRNRRPSPAPVRADGASVAGERTAPRSQPPSREQS